MLVVVVVVVVVVAAFVSKGEGEEKNWLNGPSLGIVVVTIYLCVLVSFVLLLDSTSFKRGDRVQIVGLTGEVGSVLNNKYGTVMGLDKRKKKFEVLVQVGKSIPWLDCLCLLFWS